MKKLVLSAICCLLIGGWFNQVQAQNLLGQFVVISNNGTTLDLQFQVKSSVTSTSIFNANFLVNWTGAGVNYPAGGSPVLGTDYSWATNFNPSTSSNHYDNTGGTKVVMDGSGDIDVVLSNDGSGTSPSINTSSFEPVVDLIFQIVSPSGSSGDVYVDTATMLSKDGSATSDNLGNVFTPGGSGSVHWNDGGMSDITVSPLPVTMYSFSANMAGDAAQINWATASETNNDYFTIERSADGKTFSPLFNIQGAGNSQTLKHYVAYDETPLSGTSYYRLKQTDFNGASQTFNMVSVYNPTGIGNFAVQSVSPTNFIDKATLYYQMPQNANVTILITDMQGNLVQELQVPSVGGDNKYSIENTAGWRPGVYNVNMVYNGLSSSIRMMKE